MEGNFFNCKTTRRTVVFVDSIKKRWPFIAKSPRNHESLFFVLKGTLLYEREGVRELIGEGQVGYIPRGFSDVSSAYNCNETTYIAINFNFEEKLGLEPLCTKNYNIKYEQLFKDALKVFSSGNAGSPTVCNGILLQIIGNLITESHSRNTNDKQSRKIARAVEYLHANYHNADFEIRTLAAISNMSEKNFRRIFTVTYQKTPYQFLRELRINKAKILLVNTAKTISDIAQECGFSDVYSFNHSFKSFTGIAPTKYRNSI